MAALPRHPARQRPQTNHDHEDGRQQHGKHDECEDIEDVNRGFTLPQVRAVRLRGRCALCRACRKQAQE
jgi:hypothetical protein